MRSAQRLLGKIKLLSKYIFFYLLGAVLIISFFGEIYLLYNVKNAFEYSWQIFWLIENNVSKDIKIWFYIERIANSLFSLIIVGNILTKFLSPLNPILFSKYVTYDTVDRIFTFKYWIMLPKNQYLYNVKIKLFLAEYEAHQRGVNKIQSKWQLNTNNLLDLARGIRFIELSEEASCDLVKNIDSMLQKYEKDDNGNYKWGIDLFIDGVSETGVNYHGHVKYKMKDILIGYKNVPMQRHSYASEDFYREYHLSQEEKERMECSKDFYDSGKKEFFRYQHFDKVYKLLNSAIYEEGQNEAEKAGDVLTRQQIEYGQYGGIKQLLIDLMSFITWFYLDSDRKVSWVFIKIGEFFLHITHIKRY